MVATPAQRTSVGEQALELFCACLGFDFIGTNPDESAEDVGTIQVPGLMPLSCLHFLWHSLLTITFLTLSHCTHLTHYAHLTHSPHSLTSFYLTLTAAWRDIVQDTSTIELLMLFYRSTEPPVSNLAMKALVHLSSVRRSIFLTDTDRMAFLSSIMGCIRDILKGGVGLQVREMERCVCVI